MAQPQYLKLKTYPKMTEQRLLQMGPGRNAQEFKLPQ